MAKKQRKIEGKTAAAVPSLTVTPPFEAPASVLSFLDKYATVIAILAVLLASGRILSTLTVFSQTSDEPVHIACGMEWLDHGMYTGEAQHPPLSRVATAIGPYLMGGHSQWKAYTKTDFTTLVIEGTRILTAGHRYDATLAAARMGTLPFFWIACCVVFAWGRRYYNRAVAALAVCIFTFIPTVLAHAGLATTDMALTAFLGAAFLTLMMWLEDPTMRRAAIFGLCAGLVIASKFSSLVFFPAAVTVSLIWYLVDSRPSVGRLWADAQVRWRALALASLVCCLAIWAVFRFSFGKVYFANISLPAPELFLGIHEVSAHNDMGHAGFLLGQIGKTGWWYFFPVLLMFKTPLGLLILLAAGLWLGMRKRLAFTAWWLPLTFSGGILLVSMVSRINIGLRHILPVYIGLSLIGAAAIYRLLEEARERRWLAGAVLILCGWFAGSSLMIHPDYLAYFNELAGDHPENIAVDSDLDWGQDFKRLGKRLKELGVDQVTLMTYYAEPLDDFGIHPTKTTQFDVVHPPMGWTAISISDWKVTRLGLYERYMDVKTWPDLIPPAERIGKGMLLWYIPPAAQSPSN
jgi:hypothetical protein